MPTSPCTVECEHLIALANDMATSLATDAREAADAPSFPGPWRAQAEALLQRPDLESLDGEQALETLALDLRHRWLQAASAQSSRYMMSPPHAQRKHLPDGARIQYPYDRWLKPSVLEQRLDALSPAPEGWASQSVLFANAMAALTTTLQVYRAFAHRFWPRPGDQAQKARKRPLSLHWFGGYFEIVKALQLLCDDHLHGRKHAEQQALRDAVEQGVADLVLIEPVAADIGLEAFDLDAFIQAWKRRRTNRPCTIVVDATLCADTFPMERLCRELTPHPPALVVQIRSGLKLDQEGLEFANVGLMNLWVPRGPDTGQAKALTRLKQIAHTVQVARTTLGASLSQDEYAALSAPFFLDPAALSHHAAAVFDNNRRFAESLASAVKPDGGLLARVIHPSLSAAKDWPWAKAPYVNLFYRPDNEYARAFLRAVLEHEARARKLSLQSGSSFGFRAHRFEMGFARGLKHKTLRVALGARRGPSLDGVIALFHELAAYPDFAALRAAYPQIASLHPRDRAEEGL